MLHNSSENFILLQGWEKWSICLENLLLGGAKSINLNQKMEMGAFLRFFPGAKDLC